MQEDFYPLVSIIIPSYNYGRFLLQTLASVQSQSYTNWECLVVDDGSTDNTRELLQSILVTDSRVHYIYQENQGQAQARNTGLAVARGAFIQFLDADDLLENCKLELQLKYFKLYPEVQLVYGNVQYFSNGSPDILFMNRWDDRGKSWMPGISGSGPELIKAFVKENILELGCALIRSETVLEGRPFNPELTGVEDYDFCFRLAARNVRFAYYPKPGSAVLMRHHEGSFSKAKIRMYKREVELRETMKDYLKPESGIDLEELNLQHKAVRLKKIQDYYIDIIRKKQFDRFSTVDFFWLLKHGNISQSLYFLPRLLKASIFQAS